jgi:hypothetical protein
VEQELARIASGSHGVVTRAELVRAGLTAGEIKQRLRTGALLREHRAVYRVGHRAPSVEARYLAAVRACGEGGALSGRAAAHLFGVLKGAAPSPEVTSPGERKVAGVRTRRSRHMSREDTTTWRGIPVTTLPRTIVDIAARIAVADLARVCHEAGVQHGVTPGDVERALARRPNAPGATKLREILRGDVRVTLSALEAGFLGHLADADLVLPPRHAWELDRRREREARARGDEFRRYTYGDVFEDPALMLAELKLLLPRAVLASGRRTTTGQDGDAIRA